MNADDELLSLFAPLNTESTIQLSESVYCQSIALLVQVRGFSTEKDTTRA